VDLVVAVEQGELAAWAREAGYAVRSAASGAEARHLALAGSVDAVVFDPTLAGDGLPAELRAEAAQLAVLAWIPVYSSARAAELLEAGSDDVLHGAIPQRETLARVEAAVRRTRRTTGAVGVELGPLYVDAAHGQTTWHNQPIRLTRRERQVLQVLAEAAGRPVRREEIYRLVWGFAMARGDRTVDVNVRRLRAKLSAVAQEAVAVETQPGVGYRLELAVEGEPVTSL
jgi:DNA-binding response OmpR family regulator